MSEEIILEEHISTDGLLSLCVIKSEDADITIGFVGYPWHTHGDILGGTSETAAIRSFVDSIINDETIIAFSLINGKVTDVFPTENPTDDLDSMRKYGAPDESMEFRYWSGKAIDGSLLLSPKATGLERVE
ncbi:MAG: hypothetical protein WBD27_18770 [Pyrinomonadaceae bacterium]